MNNVIGLVGLKQHGKDTAADILIKEHGFKKGAFAKLLKEICMEHFDLSWDQVYGDQKEVPDPRWTDARGRPRTPRFILQFMGTQGFRAVDPDFWVKTFYATHNENDRYVMCDVRFQNELDAVLERGGKIWVVDMRTPAGGVKPEELSIWARFKYWITRTGPYHASERMARKLVSLGRKGKLDPGFVYVPFVYGDRSQNLPVVLKAWHETTRPIRSASHLRVIP